MKAEVISKLTSSKNERIAFSVIWDKTIGAKKVSRLILNDSFLNQGISNRKALNLAVNRLIDKGLIIKRLDEANNYDFDIYRYQVLKSGCSHFLNHKGMTDAN